MSPEVSHHRQSPILPRTSNAGDPSSPVVSRRIQPHMLKFCQLPQQRVVRRPSSDEECGCEDNGQMIDIPFAKLAPHIPAYLLSPEAKSSGFPISFLIRDLCPQLKTAHVRIDLLAIYLQHPAFFPMGLRSVKDLRIELPLHLVVDAMLPYLQHRRDQLPPVCYNEFRTPFYEIACEDALYFHQPPPPPIHPLTGEEHSLQKRLQELLARPRSSAARRDEREVTLPLPNRSLLGTERPTSHQLCPDSGHEPRRRPPRTSRFAKSRTLFAGSILHPPYSQTG